jgi:hypothetical protein
MQPPKPDTQVNATAHLANAGSAILAMKLHDGRELHVTAHSAQQHTKRDKTAYLASKQCLSTPQTPTAGKHSTAQT